MPVFTQSQLEHIQKRSASVRARPAMYLGAGGVNAISRMIDCAMADILGLCRGYRELIEVSVSSSNEITIRFNDLKSDTFPSGNVEVWFKEMFLTSRQAGLTLGLVALASQKFRFTSSDGTHKTTLSLGEGKTPVIHSRATRGKPFVQVSFESALHPAGSLTHNHLYNIASRLKNVSLLRPGLSTCLSATHLARQISYFYEHGLRSMLFEDDHTRWPLHDDCIAFAGRRRGMSVEGYLRFLHAGAPAVRSYVNFCPSQGGAHHEGLGRALTEVFPDSTRGCRKVLFITNSNSGAAVELPHSFIGAMHLQIDDPKYEGPTKDILSGDEVRDFVSKVAAKQVREQLGRVTAKALSVSFEGPAFASGV